MAIFTVLNVERETEKGILAEVSLPVIVPKDGAYEVQVVQRKGWIPKSQTKEGRINPEWLRQQYDNPLFNPASKGKKKTQEEPTEAQSEYAEF